MLTHFCSYPLAPSLRTYNIACIGYMGSQVNLIGLNNVRTKYVSSLILVNVGVHVGGKPVFMQILFRGFGVKHQGITRSYCLLEQFPYSLEISIFICLLNTFLVLIVRRVDNFSDHIIKMRNQLLYNHCDTDVTQRYNTLLIAIQNWHQLIILIMFEGRSINCSMGKPAALVCTNPDCNSYLFVCQRSCECGKNHDRKCVLKNIKDLSNGIQTVLKRNFCKTFKGEGIQVVARVARQMIQGPRNFRFCLTECRADPKRDMEFMVRTLKGCVGIGVIHKPTIIKHMYQYLPDQDYINHGAYMLLSNGYQYSHTELDENFKQYKGIKMEEGDKVKICMDEKGIMFQQNSIRVWLKLPHNMQDLYYGVYLYEQGDQVEVLVKK